jgi:hypothetical protein
MQGVSTAARVRWPLATTIASSARSRGLLTCPGTYRRSRAAGLLALAAILPVDITRLSPSPCNTRVDISQGVPDRFLISARGDRGRRCRGQHAEQSLVARPSAPIGRPATSSAVRRRESPHRPPCSYLYPGCSTCRVTGARVLGSRTPALVPTYVLLPLVLPRPVDLSSPVRHSMEKFLHFCTRRHHARVISRKRP